MRILIIPEDPTTDQYVLKPIIESMMARLGKPRAIVRVLQDPHMKGVDDALNRDLIKEIVDRYRGMVDVFLLIVDRDNRPGRVDALRNIENIVAEMLKEGQFFLGENAWQETEVWLLAGHTLPATWRWAAIRADTHPKENFYEPFAEQKGVQNHPGGGRSILGLQAALNYAGIRGKCTEDVQALEIRLAEIIQ